MTEIDTSELRMLSDTVGRFAADHAAQADASASLWQQMAELGLLALPFSEENGGMGMGLPGIDIVMQAMGTARLAVPFLPFAVISGGALESSAAHPDFLEGIMGGERRIAAGFLTAGTVNAEGKPLLTATPSDDEFVLSGQVSDILALDQADEIIVSASIRTDNEPALFLVELNDPAIVKATYSLTDGRMAGKICFNTLSAPASSLIARGKAYEAIMAKLEHRTLVAVAAQNLGVMRYLFGQTLEYAKLRKQFGRAIGSFQSLQFRIVDMWIKLEEARALIAAAVQSEGTPSFAGSAKAAWIQTLWSGRQISEEAIQIHGAIAMTEEYAVGDFVKTLLVNEYLFGSAEQYLADYQPALPH